MLNSKKKTVSFILFVVILIVLTELLKFALIDDVSLRNNIERCTDNTYDVVFIGTSQLRSGVAPQIIDEVTGLTSTNAAIPLSTSLDQYYFVKELNERGHKPDRILYEVDPYYFTDGKAGGHYDAYPFGLNRIEYFFESLQQDWRAILAPWSFQWQNYSIVNTIVQKKIDFYRNGYDREYNGYAPTDAPFKPKNIVDREFAASDLSDEYLRKLIEYCDLNDIELTLVQFPVPQEVYDEKEPAYRNGADAYFSSIAQDYGIGYLNCNEWPKETFDRSYDYFVDMEGHLRFEASVEFSKCMGGYINDLL